ncbi:hypothetical protein Tco_0406909 [Tanacetum coccineum]
MFINSSGSKYGNATCSSGPYRIYAKLLDEKDQEEKSIVELLAEERFQKDNQVLNERQSSQEMKIQDLEFQKKQCLEEMKEWMNELGIREYRKEEIHIDYRRKCEDKIFELKDKFNGLSIEFRRKIHTRSKRA